MTDTKEQIVFSEIPMRTWRWLGVNEAKMPAIFAPIVPVTPITVTVRMFIMLFSFTHF